MPFRVALVNMPFGFHIYPSIQLGTLSSLLKSQGWDTDCYYLNLQFAHQIDFSVYKQLCEKRFLAGEWLFSELLFGDSPKNREYPVRFAAHMREVCQSIARPLDFLLDIKTKMVPEFLRWAVEAIDWGRYGIVGFSSTFNQNIASVTLAKLIKEKHPGVKIMFGGSNFESEMGLEYFRAFPWIDYAVSGEAENVLPQALTAIEQEAEIPKGVAHRKNGDLIFAEAAQMVANFENHPPPDYDDYFEQLRQIDPQSTQLGNPVILYETARGCWWGEKHHCTFCGLNATNMKFRSKPADQVRSDIAYLSKRHDTYRFRMVDNILEMDYVDQLFARFAEENLDLQFFLEVKSNLTHQQIKTLARGGVNVIQPGIESFSENQLQAMDKGVRPMQNVLCLKWALYYGVEVSWNILTGFPGEVDDDYRKQTELIESLIHLQPPLGVGTLWLERFSPYFTQPDKYGISIKGPGEAYPYVYDGRKLDLMKIAYDFEFESGVKINPKLVEALQKTVSAWQERHRSDNTPYLFFTKSLDFVTVYDGRPKDSPTKTRYEGARGRIIAFCNEKPKTLEQIRAHLQEKKCTQEEMTSMENILQELIDKRILYGERGKYLTLALPHNSKY